MQPESHDPAQPAAPRQPYAHPQQPYQGYPPYQQPGAGQPHYQQAAASPAAMSAKARHGQRNMIFGGLWLGAGLLITLITLSSGSPVVVVAWGAILGGLIQFISGARAYSRNKG